jgi:ABC-2 type transport system ATP-binding protein
MIRTTGLTKIYGVHPAIQGLSFEAAPHEVLGFLGPNGAGKTTTMRILAGFMPPTEGTAEVAGFDVVDQSLEVRRRVGYLPETVPLYPDLSVSEYLEFMGSLRSIDHLEDRIEEVLQEVGCGALGELHRQPEQGAAPAARPGAGPVAPAAGAHPG